MSIGLTPAQLLQWLRDRAPSGSLDESSEVIFSEFLYQVPYWERLGYWDVEQYYGRYSGTPTPVSAFADFISATISRLLKPPYESLKAVALGVSLSSQLHGVHAFDKRSQAHAIVVGAQLMIALPRANINFLYVLNAHQLSGWHGQYDEAATLLQQFLGLSETPSVGTSSPKGMLLFDNDRTKLASRLLGKLARELVEEPQILVPWMIEPEGVEWLLTAALVQQLFIVLHEFGHANEAWPREGEQASHELSFRGFSDRSDSLDEEDRADVWAAMFLQDCVTRGDLVLDSWLGDVRGYLKEHRWPLPSSSTDILVFSLFLLFEYLHVAQRLDWIPSDKAHRPPRARFNRIAKRLRPKQVTASSLSEMRQLMETLTTMALFAGDGRRASS